MITLHVKDATPMNANVALPEGKGPFPAVMVFQEAWGVNGYMRGIADRLAKEGYLAVVPELFHRTAPAGFEAAYGDFSVVAPHFQALTPEHLINDVRSTYDWLMTQDNVIKDKIGCIGFCLGGRVSFIANCNVKLAASVSFYGGQTHTVADMAATASGPHLMFWGGKDTHILQEHVTTVVDAFKANSKDYINVVVSYADHAFFNNERPAYNAEAASEAWGMTKVFFKNKLG
jgi:carboxymethylenebutenolidase